MSRVQQRHRSGSIYATLLCTLRILRTINRSYGQQAITSQKKKMSFISVMATGYEFFSDCSCVQGHSCFTPLFYGIIKLPKELRKPFIRSSDTRSNSVRWMMHLIHMAGCPSYLNNMAVTTVIQFIACRPAVINN